MIKKNYLDVSGEDVTMADSKGATIRWLITDEDGATRYVMRRFDINKNGKIGLHHHPEEHEIYVLSGKARVFDDKGFETYVCPGDVLFISPYEKHGYENSSEEPFTFLCVIPILKSRQ